MLDYVCIFTKGGALLWTWSLVSGSALRGNPVDALIRNWLLEERSGETSFSYTPPSGAAYSLKWTLHNVGPITICLHVSRINFLSEAISRYNLWVSG